MTSADPATRVQHAAIGPPTHGVVRYAAALAAHARPTAGRAALGVHTSHSLPAPVRTQVQAAAAAGPVVATLHDLDGIGDRRPERDCYDGVVRTADLLVAPTDEEVEVLVATWGSSRAALVPHHVDHRAVLDPTAARRALGLDDRPTVGLLGHQYPGKGSEAVVRAAAGVPGVAVVLVGGALAEHATQLATLRRTAATRGVRVVATGWLDEAELDAWLAAVDVGVVASERAAASGSLATWVGAARAPLVRSGRPAHRHALAHWGVGLPTFDPPELSDALRAALDAPATTRVPPAGRGPGAEVAAARYDALVGAAKQ